MLFRFGAFIKSVIKSSGDYNITVHLCCNEYTFSIVQGSTPEGECTPEKNSLAL